MSGSWRENDLLQETTTLPSLRSKNLMGLGILMYMMDSTPMSVKYE